MNRMFAVSFAFLVAAGTASAATLNNVGNTPVVLQVAETSGRVDVSLEPGQSQEICPEGCFITLPNGDHVGLTGAETVDIEDSTATVR